ncbi:MAG: HRDC domain-containing protein, partial [Chromatiaceae bacterium]
AGGRGRSAEGRAAGGRQERERRKSGFEGDLEASALWERLRALRLALAQQQNLPPYVIFGDITLRELVQYRPRNLEEMSCISGIGAVKRERYGEAFLAALAAHAAEHGYPANWRPG